MNIKKLILQVSVIIIIAAVPCFAQSGFTGKKADRILILNSYHKGFAWTDGIVESLQKNLGSGAEPAEIHIEYMDTKRFFSDSYLSRLYTLYRFKYSAVRFSCIISTDDDALNFLMRYGKRIFGDTPVVFCGVNRQNAPDTLDRRIFTGIMEEDSPEQTIRLMRILHPGLKKIFVICDYTTTGRARFSSLQSVIPLFGDISFIFSKNDTLGSVLYDIENYGEEVPLLLLAFFKDSSGKDYSYTEFVNVLYPYAKGPVYTVALNYMGPGIAGGVLNSPENQGREAAAICRRILHGESPEKIAVIRDVKNRAVIDYSTAVEKGIDISLIPGGTVIINKPPGFYDFLTQNKAYIMTIFTGFLLLIVVILIAGIVLVMRTNRKRKKIVEELGRAMNEVKTLSGLLPICASCKKIRDDTGYWNQIEQYLEDHSDAEFTHSLCPECAKRLYPDIFE